MFCVHLNPQQDMDISNILATDKMTADRCLYLIIYIICGVRCYIEIDKFALLWGEAQLFLSYVCL